MPRCPWAVAFLVSLSVHAAAWAQTVLLQTWHDPARQRDIPVKIYLPADAEPAPVALVSHGLGGTREAMRYLGEALSRAGYVAVHLQHPGSDDSVWRGEPASRRMTALRGAAGGAQFMDRCRDVAFALDHLAADAELRPRLDLDRVAMLGHSFGAVTTQAVCGQRYAGVAAFREPRIRCGVLLSPSVPERGDPADAFAGIDVPLLHLTGTRDDSAIGRTTPDLRRVPFDSIDKAPQYLIIFEDADHMVFSGRSSTLRNRPRDDDWHAAIAEATTRFLDAHLRNDAAARAWLDEGGLRDAIGPLGIVETHQPTDGPGR